MDGTVWPENWHYPAVAYETPCYVALGKQVPGLRRSEVQVTVEHIVSPQGDRLEDCEIRPRLLLCCRQLKVEFKLGSYPYLSPPSLPHASLKPGSEELPAMGWVHILTGRWLEGYRRTEAAKDDLRRLSRVPL